MMKIENIEVLGWEHAIRGMRNLMNKAAASDSGICKGGENGISCVNCANQDSCEHCYDNSYQVGKLDHSIMIKFRNAGSEHRKFMQMINVYLDITAPLYWWNDFDSYTLEWGVSGYRARHNIREDKFTLDSFSCEHLNAESLVIFNKLIEQLNKIRNVVIDSLNWNEQYWGQIIQLLPTSLNQKRTIMLNYEVLSNIYKDLGNHKVEGWIEVIEWIEKLPHSELITGKDKNILKGESTKHEYKI